MLKGKRLKIDDVPEGLVEVVQAKLGKLPRTIRKDAVVLMEFSFLPEHYAKTLVFLRARFDHVLENGQENTLYVVPIDHYLTKLSARDMFSGEELDILGLDYVSAILGSVNFAEYQTKELKALLNQLIFFVQGKQQWSEFLEFRKLFRV